MIMRFTAAFVLFSVIHAAEPQALFNGKDLAGWTFDSVDPKIEAKSVWSVFDGILICKGRPPGLMRTEKEFSNYELTVEWRWTPGGKTGNSGVLIHASKPKELFIWPKSIEVQLGTGNAGDFWTNGEKLTVAGTEPLEKGRRWVKKAASTEKPPGQWNTIRIRCKGAKVTAWVNGTLMNEATGLSATKGAICLQCEDKEVHFRKVELKPID